jgi:hypothetical protein
LKRFATFLEEEESISKYFSKKNDTFLGYTKQTGMFHVINGKALVSDKFQFIF